MYIYVYIYKNTHTYIRTRRYLRVCVCLSHLSLSLSLSLSVCVCVCVCIMHIFGGQQVELRKVEGVTQMAPWRLSGSKMWVGDSTLRPTASEKGAEAVRGLVELVVGICLEGEACLASILARLLYSPLH